MHCNILHVLRSHVCTPRQESYSLAYEWRYSLVIQSKTYAATGDLDEVYKRTMEARTKVWVCAQS
jgi:hypothetical protein